MRGLACFVFGAVLAGACANAEMAGGNAPVDGPADASIDALDACAPVAETCNDADDDCDAAIDEDFATKGTACTAGAGACVAAGTYVCAADGAGVICDARPGDGSAETCNGINDDCDGMTDEGFGVGTPCDGADLDQCREGMVVCAATGGGTTCSDGTGDAIERCNGTDDDCDLATDEGFALGTMCDGGDTDACAEGMVVCTADGSATCSDATTSTVERCNGADDDCRNGIDDGFAVGQACSVGIGACARSGQYACDAQGTGVVCSAVSGAATAETCGDGIDQDCNGSDAACPTNDAPAGAINVSAGGTFTADLIAARDDDANAGTGCGSTGGRDLFYQLTLAAPEVVYLHTYGSSFDSVIRVYAGACTARGGAPVCDDDAGACNGAQSALATQLAAGTWCIVVDQYSALQTTGASSLTVVRGGRAGTAIAAGNGTQTGTTCGAQNVFTPGCQSVSSAGEQAYYFSLCPGETRAVGASTCSTATSWDSVVYLRQAPASSDVGCSDDACGRLSTISGVNAVGPGLFWLVVDGYQAACGAFTLSYTM